jgi:NAD(P)-dependent dehydrogenase (short-subunit alcohol dehydrogenase family)
VSLPAPAEGVLSSFQGRTILVTGASSGIGRGVARRLAQLGARLVLNGRRPEALEETRASLAGDGHVAAPAALEDLDMAATWLQDLAALHGPFQGVVHCAGIQQAQPLKGLRQKHADETMRINVDVALGLIKGFRAKGVHTDDGAIVLMASIMGLVGQPLQTLYSASKGAVIALTRSAALELAPEGLRINCLAPAIVETELVERLRARMTPEQFEAVRAAHPLGLGRVEDVADAAAFLLGGTARWITGTALVLDGGYSAR